MKVANLVGGNAYEEAIEGWSKVEDRVRLGQKIRIDRE